MKIETQKLVEEFVAYLATDDKSSAHSSFNKLIEQMIAARITEKTNKLFESKAF